MHSIFYVISFLIRLYDFRFISLISIVNTSFVMMSIYFKSYASIIKYFNSCAEPKHIVTNLLNSLSKTRPKPSLKFDGIEYAARCICDTN
jgi:hypothetical protein